MSILDQIDKIIKKGIKGDNNNALLSLTITEGYYFLSHCESELDEIGTKEEIVTWLNENGWNIKEKHGS